MGMTRHVGVAPSFMYMMVCILIVTLTTFNVVLPRLLSNLGYSKYFTRDSGRENVMFTKETQRNTEAMEYFRKLDLEMMQNSHHSLPEKPSLSILIPTTKRRKSHYLIQVTARLVQEYTQITRITRNIKEITIVNNNDPTFRHDDAIFLSHYVTVINNTKTDTDIGDFYTKQCKDMTQTLSYGIESQSDFILVLEDDSLPLKGFMNRLDDIMTRLVHMKRRNISEIALVKLYFPDKWYGYEYQLDDLVEIITCAGVLSCATTTLIYLLLRKCTLLKHKHSKIFFSLLFVYLIIYFAVIIYSVGRVHWIELFRTVCPKYQTFLPAPRCCTPAVLYPRLFAMALQKNIECTTHYPYDFALDDTVKRKNLKQYLVFPNMLTHIGYESSSPSKRNKLSEYMFMFDGV